MPYFRPPRSTVVIALIALQILFGINEVTSRHLAGVLPGLPWLSLKSFVTTILLFVAVQAIGEPKPKGNRFYFPMAILAFLGVIVGQYLAHSEVKSTELANHSVLSAIFPLFAFGLVAGLRREKITPPLIAGFLLATIGALVVAHVEEFRFSSDTLSRDLLTLGGSLSFALFLVFAKSLFEQVRPFWATTWMFVFTTVLFTAVAFPQWLTFRMPVMTMEAWMSVAFAIVGGTLAAFLLVNWLLSNTESSEVALYFYLSPVVTALAEWWWLGNSLPSSLFVGALLIGVGLVVGTYWKSPGQPAVPALDSTPETAWRKTGT